jgi:type III secretion apparatus needle protein
MSVDLQQIGATLGANTTTATTNLETAMKNAASGKPEDMVAMQMAMQKWTMTNQLQSTMVQQLGECIKGIIQKM